jgi:hypothetical protein
VETALQEKSDQDDVAALLLRVCIVVESEYQQFQDAVASGTAWADFWNSFSVSDPLVLQPASHYTLQVEGNWSRVKEGAETAGGTFDRRFEFDTVGLDDWPQTLRGIDQSVDGKSSYDIKTFPAAGDIAIYPSRPIRLELRHRRIELMYGAFGRRLAMRLVDDQGIAIVRWLEYTPQPSSDLPDSEAGWHDVVTSSTCTSGDLDWHWHFPVVKYTDILFPGRRYDLSLYALDGSIPDPAGVALTSEPVIYQFTFRTSRYPALSDHLSACTKVGAYDEIVPGTAPFGQIAAALAGAARVADDPLLAATLFDSLELPRRDAPADPELVRVWQNAGTGPELVGLLIDGPEPLVRPIDGGLQVNTATHAPIDTVLLQGIAGTRTLILFRNGASGLKSIVPQDLEIVVTDAWIAADGSRQVDTATLLLTVPPRPAVLDPEGPP